MLERTKDRNLGAVRERISAVADKLFIAGAVGSFLGLPAYGISRILTDQEMALKVGLGVGGGVASAGLGVSLSSLSMQRAENYIDQGREGRAHLEVARAILEGGLGFGVAAAIPGIESSDPVHTAIGAVGGTLLGSFCSFLKYRERIKPFPELILPPGNSVQRDMSFPRSLDGIAYPPVFRATSLRDLIEFREVNKEVIMKWAGATIPTETNDPNSIAALRLVTSVAIIPELQHYPVLDPKEQTSDMILRNGEDTITVHPCRDTFMVWPYQTRFESIFGKSRTFEGSKWRSWRERSWRNEVVLLTQYQTRGNFSYPTPGTISDHYWLLDINPDWQNQRTRVY